ncbi:MAG TPA: acetate kinase [Candidatus Scybalousia intestinigallinarum]|nr:acetate kinase [Candidatus Scybalousia intestinigallinarum]
MKIMSINAGSSSLKFSLFEMDKNECIASGYFERVTLEGSFYTIKYKGEKIKEEVAMPNHTVAVEVLLDRLVTLGIIKSLKEIDGVGHRLVHGGDKYKSSVVITDEVIEDLRKYSELAPLHNPANILGIEAVRNALPNVLMVGVFDTAFHQTMDPVSYIYPVPYEWYTKYGVRKYGFHGTSHCYISKQIPRLLGREDYRAIICHLGSGGSISAVKNGKCVDTTMGFTPLAGIMMGTRSGDIDPSIIPYMMDKEGVPVEDIMNVLNKESGFLGLSQYGSDFRDVYAGIEAGNEQCKLAFDKYVRTVVNYIASYYVELGGADIICFTAGLGENAWQVREAIMKQLSCLGIKIDLEKNKVQGEEIKISSDDSSVCCYVVPTNEELMIALDTLSLIEENR